VEINGTCADRFEGVRDALETCFAQHDDVGASVAVSLDGELVVDLWAGHVDEERTTPWADDTIINVWSTTKTMTNLCALLLADRGELDLHAPVARYWPEFKAGGKENVTTAHLLGHTSGLAAWQEPVAPEDLYDWELCCSRLAVQEPWWEPGTASGYHAISQGYLVGEVVRRASGAASLGSFFRTELAEPRGAAFHIGTGPELDHRVATVIPPPNMQDQMGEFFAALGPDHVMTKTLTNPALDAAQSQTVPWRRCESPAVNGHGNARSVALVQSVVACGGELSGRRFLSEEGCRAVFETQATGPDLVLGVPVHMGTGYGICGDEFPLAPAGNRAHFWGGWGGSLVVIDQTARLADAYVMNRMGLGTVGDERGIGIVGAAYAALSGA
jgi:CubicO group peptidase (beta-lactamase class C family)